MNFLFQFLFLVGFPAFFSAGVAYLCWRTLARPWLFVLALLTTLYALYALAFYLFGPQSVGYAISAAGPGDPPVSEPWLMLLEPYAKPLGIFAVAALLTAYVLTRLFAKSVLAKD